MTGRVVTTVGHSLMEVRFDTKTTHFIAMGNT